MKKNKTYAMTPLRYLLLIGIVVFSFIQCKSDSIKKSPSSEEKKVEVKIPIPPSINYHIISTKDSIEWLKALPFGDTLQALLVLNRIDKHSLLRLDSLLFPDSIGVGISLYSPFPPNVDELNSVNKILFVSYYAQAFAVYENGRLIKWGPSSLGKKSTLTPTGLHATNWKAKRTVSTVDKTWIMDWYFNLENHEGVSMHQYALPGYPASHSCVRLYDEDAYWLYNWADQWVLDKAKISVYGTPVLIFGTYPFGERKPWLLMAENKKALEITPSELMNFTKEYLPTILERQAKRDSLQSRL